MIRITRRDALHQQLDKLLAEYSALTGAPFHHFLCPILLADDDVPLCRAHIVNKAFKQYTRRWTIQRSDVDAFFGSVVESDFVTLPDRLNLNAASVLTDRELSRRLRPEVWLDGKRIAHYVTEGPVPPNHLELSIAGIAAKSRLVLKVPPEQMLSSLEGRWEVRMERDLRVAAVGSLIKAAHLTLFEMLGYRFALSMGGRFAGPKMLGEFFLKHRNADRSCARAGGQEHFPRFASLVRPVVPGSSKSKGTATDRHVLLCQDGELPPWGMIVFVRTRDLMHAVLMPVFSDQRGEERFHSFLDQPFASIDTRLAHFWAQQWLVSPSVSTLDWPADTVSPASCQCNDWPIERGVR